MTDATVHPEHIQRFLDEVVGVCPYCETEITRTTKRALDHAERLCCYDCAHAATELMCVICCTLIKRSEPHSESVQRAGVWGHKACIENYHNQRRRAYG